MHYTYYDLWTIKRIMSQLYIYNTLERAKVPFEPIAPPHVGLYVCGPTVYGDPHLGHARSAITFDILYRYLKHLGYKVRYVRNVTDVGHLEPVSYTHLAYDDRIRDKAHQTAQAQEAQQHQEQARHNGRNG